jgi:integrase/recombinase XerC
MIDSFINYLEYEKRASKHTVLAYQKDLSQFEDFVAKSFSITELSEVQHADIRAWLIDLVEQKLTPTSVNRKIATLRSFFKYLLRSGIITKDPTYKVKTLKVPKRLPEFIQEESIEQIINEFQYTEDFNGQRDRMVMEFLYLTGVRLSEMLALTWRDLDLIGATVKVLGKRKKERVIPLTPYLVSHINAYKSHYNDTFKIVQPADNFIVTDKKSAAYPMMIYRIVNLYVSRFAQTKKRSPHLLRHTFATHLLNKGADLNAVKDLLGHANLAATQVYTHNSMEKLKAVYEQAHPKA